MKRAKNYRWATYRRRMLDFLQEKYSYLYRGTVLDIGGRARGRFEKPRDKVEKWIFADINKDHNPDIVLDVAIMEKIASNSIDVINAIELFEHVQEIKKGLKECHRVLKKNGVIIISTPFLFQIHSDPYDFQRWTNTKWKIELKKAGFSLEKIIIMGRFYTHLAEVIKTKLKYSKANKIFSIFIPLLDLMCSLDNQSFKNKNSKLNDFHNGYFIIAKKRNISMN